MALIHHVVKGNGQPPVVFVHGFGCAHTDWDLQIAHLSPRLQTIAVDLRGHGASPGTAAECSTERYGDDVAEVMRALALPPAILVGHSMGCRVDGSQLAAAMEGVLKERFATPDGYTTTVNGLLQAMFTAKSAKTVAASIIERAPYPAYPGDQTRRRLRHARDRAARPLPPAV